MSTETTETKKRTPRDFESISKGALSLPLADRVALKKELDKSISDEVTNLKAAAEQAEAVAKS